ncbi:MAG: hypothetical protein AAB421_02910 [Patescibacteria group bacterium]
MDIKDANHILSIFGIAAFLLFAAVTPSAHTVIANGQAQIAAAQVAAAGITW